MSRREHSTVAVRILFPSAMQQEIHTLPDGDTGFPRSKLYGLNPCEVGNVWTESFTSYINRLGWRHGVAPLVLIQQEIVPILDLEWGKKFTSHNPSVFRSSAMGLNGSGNFAASWINALSQLTMRSDLSSLTSVWNIGNLPHYGNLRRSPAWCPDCYQEWQKQGVPIYQPLLWMLQAMVICPRHQKRLLDRCPFCQKTQAIFTSEKSRLGECTKCARWLGAETEPQETPVLDEELIAWQIWILQNLQTLKTRVRSSEVIQWETFFAQLAVGMKEWGSFSRLARITGIHREALHRWVSGVDIPSFEKILKFCYICNTTPLQIMNGQFASLQEVIQNETSLSTFRHHPVPRNPVNYDYCPKVLHDICEGKEDPPVSMLHLAQRLGCEVHALTRHFPQECALISDATRKHRQQRQGSSA
jgi:transcriptional regulator with XRE-family HTH domain